MNELDTPPAAALSDVRLPLIAVSFQRLTGKALLDRVPDNPRELALALWNAPHAVVAHGTEFDPVFSMATARRCSCSR